MTNWYQIDTSQVLEQIQSNQSDGLSESQVIEHRARYGSNELIEAKARSKWKILQEQLTSIMVIILYVAAIIAIFLNEWIEAVVILIIVALNATIGFQQENKAEQSMAALKRLSVPIVKARRSGQLKEISATELVPGDIVILETGNRVPADGRVLLGINLRIEEAALTGESEPIEKDADLIFETERPLGDRRNMVFMGTIVNYGRGEFVVTETGMQTELGHIASMIQSVEQEPTPLQQRLDKVGKILALVALVIVLVIFVLGILEGIPFLEMLETAISLAVAAVPEALPAVATIALALGAQRMLKRKALIRKLPAVETLGSVNVICSDKTGTLTKNEMTVTVLDIANHRLDLKKRLDNAGLEVIPSLDSLTETAQPTIDLLLIAGALDNDALLQKNVEHPGQHKAIGDPTEAALVMAADEMGLAKEDLEKAMPRVAEAPFDSVRKRMTTVHRTPQSHEDVPPSLLPIWERRLNQQPTPYVAFTKGAIDGMLSISSDVLVNGHNQPLDDTWRTKVMIAHDNMAQKGMRILGIGVRPMETLPAKISETELEKDIILLGLVGMIDPPRPEVKDAVAICKSAGIRTVMITGDHPLTARHIAEQLGMIEGGNYLIGQELDRLSPDELNRAAREVSVFARVSPEHKLILVNALQAQGYTAAMTGDGVNDAPALKKANIGVAMGITGTDVTKEAADMVLQDDNFATIVAAVEEGRVIYDNIRKVLRYLLSCNSAEIAVMLLGPLFGMPLPLLPLQILWMNLVTDGLPALALTVEPAEKNTMKRPPNPAAANIFDRLLVYGIIIGGILMAIIALFAGGVYLNRGQVYWQTMLFTTLTLSQMTFALGVRSDTESLFRIGLLSNKSMLGAIALTFILQVALIYVPFLNRIFSTTPLEVQDFLIALGLSLVVLAIAELIKRFQRQRKK